jgi:hypothetical protein
MKLSGIVDGLLLTANISFENDELIEISEGMTDPEIKGKLKYIKW